MELSTIRQEIDRRIHEKEEEFEATRRNHARAIESMQASLEAETRAKAEALKQVRAEKNNIFIILHCNNYFVFRKRNLNQTSMNLNLR
jgi:hypothetical protein